MMRWIVATGFLMVIGALFYVSRFGQLPPAVVAVTVGGVFTSVLLGCGLFALGFYSDKSGHDTLVSEATPSDSV